MKTGIGFFLIAMVTACNGEPFTYDVLHTDAGDAAPTDDPTNAPGTTSGLVDPPHVDIMDGGTVEGDAVVADAAPTDPDPTPCNPTAPPRDCACPNGTTGTQVCASNGMSYEACICDDPNQGSGGASSGSPASGGTGGATTNPPTGSGGVTGAGGTISSGGSVASSTGGSAQDDAGVETFCYPNTSRPCNYDGIAGMETCLSDGSAYGMCQPSGSVPGTYPGNTRMMFVAFGADNITGPWEIYVFSGGYRVVTCEKGVATDPQGGNVTANVVRCFVDVDWTQDVEFIIRSGNIWATGHNGVENMCFKNFRVYAYANGSSTAGDFDDSIATAFPREMYATYINWDYGCHIVLPAL